MTPSSRAFVGIIAALTATASEASFHTYDINEVFSNADGTIQFIELREANGNNNQHLFANRVLDAGTGQFTFGSNLPSSATANTFILVATAAFSALPGAPTPDYTMADGFVDVGGDTIRLCGSSTCSSVPDTLTFPALPVNGIDSFTDGSGVGVNSPTNFAGATGSVETGVPGLGSFGLAMLAVGLVLIGSRAVRAGPAAAATT